MIEIIAERLVRYNPQNALEEDNAIKEILQEIALYGLWRVDFFDIALFQGGTSLRILHGLPRFSEDLDFILRAPDIGFEWPAVLNSLTEVFEQFGLELEVQNKDHMDSAMRHAVLKDNSVAKQLDLRFAGSGQRKTTKIKLEIDTNPPALSGEATSFLDFPADYEVRHQDLPSNFALKIHAILCRKFLKGRDWFDFAWYVAKGVKPNLAHLRAALIQKGPWEAQNDLTVDMAWLEKALMNKINEIEWPEAINDVERFLRPVELKSVRLWSEPFFQNKVSTMRAANA